jgi:hypothetical protein
MAIDVELSVAPVTKETGAEISVIAPVVKRTPAIAWLLSKRSALMTAAARALREYIL